MKRCIEFNSFFNNLSFRKINNRSFNFYSSWLKGVRAR